MKVPPKSSIDKISPFTSGTIVKKQTVTICIIMISVFSCRPFDPNANTIDRTRKSVKSEKWLENLKMSCDVIGVKGVL